MAASVNDPAEYPLALPVGTAVGGLEIERVLQGDGPFAITYLAQDRSHDRAVVARELFPRAVVSRAADGIGVRTHAPQDDAAFARYLRRFVREGELLAEVRHESLPSGVAVVRTHGTACLVSDHVAGVSLAQLLEESGRLPAERAVAIAVRLLDALQLLHGEGLIHGFLTPENVRVGGDGVPVLLGFGTTRSVLGSAREPVAAYAAIEQYASRDVGPWTDVHGCAALLHTMLAGAPPVPAIERAAGRALVPLTEVEGIPDSLAATVAAGLSMRPEARPHSAEELRRRLEAGAAMPRVPRRAGHSGEVRADPPAGTDGPLDLILPTRAGLEAHAMSTAPEQPSPSLAGILAALQLDEPSAGSRPWHDRLRTLVRPRTAAAVVGVAALLVASAMTLPGLDADLPGAGAPRRALAVPTPPPAATPFTAPAGDLGAPPAASVAQDSIVVAQSGDVVTPRDAAAPDPRRVEVGARRIEAPTGPVAAVSAGLAAPAAAPLPFGIATELRERISQGRVKAEFGDYAAAVTAFTGVVARAAALDSSYRGDAALAAIRREAGEETDRVRRACAAENVVRRARNAEALQCG